MNNLGLVSDRFGGLWAIWVVPSCLVAGPERIKVEEYCLLGCMALGEKVWLKTG